MAGRYDGSGKRVAFRTRSPSVTARGRLVQVLLDLRLDRALRHGADHRVDDLPSLEEEDRRDRAHIVARGGPDVLVDVELGDLRLARVLRRELLHDRLYHAARAA